MGRMAIVGGEGEAFGDGVEAFEAAGGRRMLTQLASAFRAEDERDRAGRKSWNDLRSARERNPRIFATVVGVNVAGALPLSAAASK